MMKHSEEFKREAVRIAVTCGLPRERVAKDLGIGKSTLCKWLAHYRPAGLVAALAKQIWRVRMNDFALRTGCSRRRGIS